MLIPASPSYGKRIGQTVLPHAGDELHHFGWNACSSALCPYAPHPHVERRYLVVPGIRSSRIYVLDTKADPRNPSIVKIVPPEEVLARTGYSRPHTVHCGPEGIYVSALGSPSGDGPGGIFLLDHFSFDVLGKWEMDRGPQYLGYDFWWHLTQDTLLTSEWGTPNQIENGVIPEELLQSKYGHQLHVWDLRKRRHVQTLDLGKEQQMVLEMRPAHDPTKTYGFVGVVVSLERSQCFGLALASPERQLANRKDHRNPGGAGRGRSVARASQGLQCRSPFSHRHQSLSRRSLSLRLLLGDRRDAAI